MSRVPPSIREHPPGQGAQVMLQNTVLYAVQADSSLLHLPARKQGPEVTSRHHARGTAAPRPRELIQSFLAAQVGADQSSLLSSPLQGRRSEEGEIPLEFPNFVFSWNSRQHEATDPSPGERRGFQSVNRAHLAREGATSPQPLQSLALSPRRTPIKAGLAGWPHSRVPLSLSKPPPTLLLSRVWEHSGARPGAGTRRTPASKSCLECGADRPSVGLVPH